MKAARYLLALVFVIHAPSAWASVLRVTPFLGITTPESRMSYGVQVGIGLFLPVSLEGEIYKVRDEGAYAAATFWNAGLRIQPPLLPVAPYLAAGLGMLREDQGTSTSSYFAANIGGGAEIKTGGHIAFQGEFRVFKISGYADPTTFKRFSAGISLKF